MSTPVTPADRTAGLPGISPAIELQVDLKEDDVAAQVEHIFSWPGVKADLQKMQRISTMSRLFVILPFAITLLLLWPQSSTAIIGFQVSFLFWGVFEILVRRNKKQGIAKLAARHRQEIERKGTASFKFPAGPSGFETRAATIRVETAWTYVDDIALGPSAIYLQLGRESALTLPRQAFRDTAHFEDAYNQIRRWWVSARAPRLQTSHPE